MLNYYRDWVAIGALIYMGKKKCSFLAPPATLALIQCHVLDDHRRSHNSQVWLLRLHLSGKNYFDVSLYSGGGGVFRKSMSENWEGSDANKYIEFLLEKKIEDWVGLKVIKNRALPMDD